MMNIKFQIFEKARTHQSILLTDAVNTLDINCYLKDIIKRSKQIILSLGLIITDISDMLTDAASHTNHPKNICRSSLYLKID